MRSCKRAAEVNSAAMVRSLTPWEWLGLRIHRMICAPCRLYLKQLKAMKDVGARLRSDTSVPEQTMAGSAKDRIRERLRAAEQEKQ